MWKKRLDSIPNIYLWLGKIIESYGKRPANNTLSLFINKKPIALSLKEIMFILCGKINQTVFYDCFKNYLLPKGIFATANDNFVLQNKRYTANIQKAKTELENAGFFLFTLKYIKKEYGVGGFFADS